MAKADRQGLFHLSQTDLACLDRLGERLGAGNRSVPLRFAILRQAERDRAGEPPASLKKVYAAVKGMADFQFARATKENPEPLAGRRTRFWLTHAESAMLDKIAARHCGGVAAAAARFCIRVQAAVDGVLKGPAAAAAT